MPNRVILAPQGSSLNDTDGLTLASFEQLFVSRSGTLYALGDNSDALQLDFGNDVVVNGEIYSADADAIDGGTSGGHSINVGRDGHVDGAVGFRADFGGNSIANSGVIAGRFGGAIRIGEGFNQIANHGTIVSTAGGTALSVGGHQNFIFNDGEITSSSSAASAITIFGPAARPGQSNTIVNLGLISSGGATAIILAGHADALVNAGRIEGSVSLGAGDDFYDGRGGSVRGTISGGAGNDLFIGGDGVDSFDGGTGIDTISYAGHGRFVIVDAAVGLSFDGVQQERIAGIESAVGTAFNDSFFGGAEDNTFDAGAGGQDVMIGGAGRDTIAYINSARGVIVDLTAQLTFDGVVNDVLSSVENATGSAFNDQLYGDGGMNVLDPGQAGQDLVVGGGGNDTVTYANSWFGMIVDLSAQAAFDGTMLDTLSSIENATGSRFNDQLYGDGVANILEGGPGADSIFTGGGADFVYYRAMNEGLDTVSDFQSGVDKFWLHRPGFANISNLTAGTNFISGAAPTATVLGPTLLYSTSTGHLRFDADGNGSESDYLIAILSNKPALLTSDFLLL